MAYRQLFAVTLTVLGLLSVGCGGDTTSAAGSSSSTEQQPPTNADQAPTSSDQAPSSSDQPLTNGEAAPDSAGSADSDRLAEVCKKFCTSFQAAIAKCDMGEAMTDLGDHCPPNLTQCQAPPNTPCVAEAADYFDCAMDLLDDFTCSDGMAAPGASALAKCNQEETATNDCFQANGLDGPDGADTGGGTDAAGSCTPAGNCVCANACASCACAAGTDVSKITACGTGACATP